MKGRDARKAFGAALGIATMLPYPMPHPSPTTTLRRRHARFGSSVYERSRPERELFVAQGIRVVRVWMEPSFMLGYYI